MAGARLAGILRGRRPRSLALQAGGTRMGARGDVGGAYGVSWQLSGNARASNSRGGSRVSCPPRNIHGDLVAGSDSASGAADQRSVARQFGLSDVGTDCDDWIGSIRALQSASGTRRYAWRCSPGPVCLVSWPGKLGDWWNARARRRGSRSVRHGPDALRIWRGDAGSHLHFVRAVRPQALAADHDQLEPRTDRWISRSAGWPRFTDRMSQRRGAGAYPRLWQPALRYPRNNGYQNLDGSGYPFRRTLFGRRVFVLVRGHPEQIAWDLVPDFPVSRAGAET